MAKMGRPKIEIKWEEFEKLCAIQCTLIEIAEWFRCSEDTIERACSRQYGETFADVYKKKSARGRISLRRKQFELATVEGNPTLLIWLGKQYLGQTDKQEQFNHGSAAVVEIDEETKRYLDQLIAISTPKAGTLQ